MSVGGKMPGAAAPPLRVRIAALVRQPAYAAVATFVLVLAAALGVWRLVHEQSLRASDSRFEQRTARITTDLQRELQFREAVLRGASGLFLATPGVPPHAWRHAENTVLIAGIAAAILFAGIAFLIACKQAGRSGGSSLSSTQSSLNEARMMGIIRSSMEAIITVDESQRIVIFNPMAEQVFGCSATEAIGTPLSRFIPERFRAAHERHVDQFGVTGVSDRQMGRQRVLFGLRSNGDEFPIEASISQIRDRSGKLYTVMLRDVTERVKADNAQKKSREELRELSANLQHVREEEKTRIARELHDDLGQQLTALKMDLSSLEQTLDAGCAAKPELLRQLRGMRRLIDMTVASVRRIAADLRPVMLDDLGLIPAIEWLASDFTNRYGIDVERQIEVGDANFTPNGATTLFRIVQEALTNVARHAQATLVTLTIRIEGGVCVLRVADNGHGAGQVATPAEKSFGLLGIRERAHMLGGSVEIHTADRKGFAITVTFPLRAVQQQETQS